MKVTPQINAPMSTNIRRATDTMSYTNAQKAKACFDKYGIDGTEEFETYSKIEEVSDWIVIDNPLRKLYVVIVYEIEDGTHHHVFDLDHTWIRG
jgi:hypothetical protein